MSSNGMRHLRNTPRAPIDARTWSTHIGYPPPRYGIRAGAARRDDYMPNARREVAAIAGRILGSFAIVLTFAGGLAYLLIRAITP